MDLKLGNKVALVAGRARGLGRPGQEPRFLPFFLQLVCDCTALSARAPAITSPKVPAGRGCDSR